jgi:hypothetical protein
MITLCLLSLLPFMRERKEGPIFSPGALGTFAGTHERKMSHES